MRVLVIDDDAAVRALLRTVLESHGHEIMEAENGRQGLHMAMKGLFDLVITDQIMPELDGLGMISRLASERYPTRYLLVSAYGLNHGVRPLGLSFLSKPFTSRQLIDAVGRLLNEPTLPELEKQWQQTKARWEEAAADFEKIIADIPSGIPHSDGMQCIEPAALRRRFTYQQCIQAFHKFKDALQAYEILGETSETSEPEAGGK